MKAFSLAFFMPVLAIVVAAQTPPGMAGASGLMVTQHRWHQEAHNPELDANVFEGNDEQIERQREEKQKIMRENAIKQRNAQSPLPSAARTSGVPQDDQPRSTAPPPRDADDLRPSVEYVYEVKVSNTGAKAVRTLVWEYVLFDSDKGSEVGRHRFQSEARVAPGKSQTLVGRTSSPPSSVVDVKKTDKQMRGQYSESVVIRRIEYADGSVWEGGNN
jgi:hypothetical protein